MQHQDWNPEILSCQNAAKELLEEASRAGATQAEVHSYKSIGLSASVREQTVESLEYHQSNSLAVTVYFNHQKGQASTTDLRPDALRNTLNAACRIAKLAQPDKAVGLAESQYLANAYPELDLYHPWIITPVEVVEKARACEAYAVELDKSIISDGINIDTFNAMTLYANTHGFTGYYLSSQHTMSCALVARDKAGNMQRDWGYTHHRDPDDLQSTETLAKAAVTNTVRRLGARRIKTCEVPVIFEARVASSLIGCFLNAISGSALYHKASFLLDHCGKLIFPKHVTIQELPYLPKGLGSAPFDEEGVIPKDRYLVNDGILQGYLLSSYSARRLGLVTTGNAGGCYNITLSVDETDLAALLNKMGTGLLITEVIGHGINLVTGDYSQGIAGFWVENGEIQYAVEEVTVAGNLRDMYRSLVAIAGDTNQMSKIKTGSILIERMKVAGE